MEDARGLQEELLRAWMTMVTEIRGNRLLSSFSMNEMLICSVLYQQRRSGTPPLTATDLCTKLHLLKSQMNHILTTMENWGLIRRERSAADKRMVCIQLRDEAIPLYLREHEKVLELVAAVYTALGPEDTKALTALMRKATAVVNDAISKEEI